MTESLGHRQMIHSSGKESLKVKVAAVAFAPGRTARDTFAVTLSLSPQAACISVVERSSMPVVKSEWELSGTGTLVLAYSSHSEMAQTALELITNLNWSPLALLIADGRQGGLGRLLGIRGPAEVLAEKLEQEHADIQIHWWQPNWISHPPRIR